MANDANRQNFARYGGRGISICARWDDYNNFLADMGNAPPGMTLDRINNDGNYEPSNCRWATRLQQAQNSSAAKWLEFNGKKLPIREWERSLGLSYGAIWHRLKNGWTLEQALTTRKKQQ